MMVVGASTPESEALSLLLARYRASHNEYAACRNSLNFLHGMALVAGPIWILLLTAVYFDFLNLRPGPDDLDPVTYLTLLVFVFIGRLVYLWWRVRRSRTLLQKAKDDLDQVSYVVVCDQSRHVLDPRLVLTDSPTMVGPKVVLPAFTPIDFREYDRLFRIY